MQLGCLHLLVRTSTMPSLGWGPQYSALPAPSMPYIRTTTCCCTLHGGTNCFSCWPIFPPGHMLSAELCFLEAFQAVERALCASWILAPLVSDVNQPCLRERAARKTVARWIPAPLVADVYHPFPSMLSALFCLLAAFQAVGRSLGASWDGEKKSSAASSSSRQRLRHRRDRS